MLVDMMLLWLCSKRWIGSWTLFGVWIEDLHNWLSLVFWIVIVGIGKHNSVGGRWNGEINLSSLSDND